VLCQNLPWRCGRVRYSLTCCEHCPGSLEERGRGLAVCALNVQGNACQLLLLNLLDWYLAAVRGNTVASWENGLELSNVVNVGSEDPAALARNISWPLLPSSCCGVLMAHSCQRPACILCCRHAPMTNLPDAAQVSKFSAQDQVPCSRWQLLRSLRPCRAP